ncbi:MAG: hypothetical protein ACFB9M_05440 [Myxococcota bacterium]
MRLVFLSSSLLIASCAARSGTSGTAELPSPSTIYTNAQWWTPAGFQPGERAVRDGEVVEPSETQDETTIVDLGGAYVIPPLGEAHNHNLDSPYSRPPPEAINARYLADGVFYVKIANAYAPYAAEISDYLSRPETVDVSFAMGGITAPGGHPEPLYLNVLRRVRADYRGKTRDDLVGQAFHAVQKHRRARRGIGHPWATERRLREDLPRTQQCARRCLDSFDLGRAVRPKTVWPRPRACCGSGFTRSRSWMARVRSR